MVLNKMYKPENGNPYHMFDGIFIPNALAAPENNCS